MRDVYVAGVGMTPFGKFPSVSVADIGWPAVKAAIADAGIEGRQIQAAYCGTVFGGMMTGQRILARIGLSGIPTTNIENACSSSSTLLRFLGTLWNNDETSDY
jgi:acetyl-CoA acetyltransferase